MPHETATDEFNQSWTMLCERLVELAEWCDLAAEEHGDGLSEVDLFWNSLPLEAGAAIGASLRRLGVTIPMGNIVLDLGDMGVSGTVTASHTNEAGEVALEDVDLCDVCAGKKWTPTPPEPKCVVGTLMHGAPRFIELHSTAELSHPFTISVSEIGGFETGENGCTRIWCTRGKSHRQVTCSETYEEVKSLLGMA